MNSKILRWLEIGNANPWIRRAWDPFFDEKSFAPCNSLEEIYTTINQGNWCLGTAFYYGDICFINQINGGDEWLTIVNGKAVDSFTFKAMSLEYFCKTVEKLVQADGPHVKVPEVIEALV